MREALRRALRERRLRRRAAARGAELVPLTPRTPDFLRGGDAPVVVAVTRDEALRLPFFLSYYRSLGCAGFVVADNESTDGSRELLRARDDVMLYAAPGSFRDARFGRDWWNWMLWTHCRGRWAVVVDADEQLVFAGDGDGGIAGLVARAESRGDRSVLAALVDVYPAGPLAAAHYAPGLPFLSAADRFDPPESYYGGACPSRYDASRPVLRVHGGVRRRRFGFAERPIAETPLLTKVPLLKVSRREGMVTNHEAWPTALNLSSTAAALLHFKLLPDLPERCRRAIRENQHWDDASEFRAYQSELEDDAGCRLDLPESRRYAGPESLDWLLEALPALARLRPRELVRLDRIGSGA